jgi:hypothetical protein
MARGESRGSAAVPVRHGRANGEPPMSACSRQCGASLCSAPRPSRCRSTGARAEPVERGRIARDEGTPPNSPLQRTVRAAALRAAARPAAEREPLGGHPVTRPLICAPTPIRTPGTPRAWDRDALPAGLVTGTARAPLAHRPSERIHRSDENVPRGTCGGLGERLALVRCNQRERRDERQGATLRQDWM